MGKTLVHACFVCEDTFPNVKQLQEHIRIHNGETPYGCGTCSCQFRTASDLKRHVESAHDTHRSYKCYICDQTYKILDSLCSHMHIHALNNQNICKICCRQFIDPPQSKFHIEVCHSTKEDRFRCENVQGSLRTKDI